MSMYSTCTHQKKALRSFGMTKSVFITLLLLTTGCDVLDVVPGDTIFRSTSRVVCFEFTNLTSGASKTVVSTDTINLDSFLADEGFSKSEIMGAEVSDITFRLRFPGQQNLSVVDRASIALRAGSSNTTVGTSSDLGSGSTTTFSLSGNNVSSQLKAASFQAVLDITGAATIQDDFLIEVEMEFNVELSGV